MCSKVLETRLDKFIDSGRESGHISKQTFIEAHSCNGISNYFLICRTKFKDVFEKSTTVRKEKKDHTENGGPKEKINHENSTVFELLFRNLYDTQTKTCTPISIGRNEENDICLSRAFLSRKHGYFILKEGSDLSYVDTSSRYGSLVDGKPVTPNTEVLVPSESVLNLGSIAPYDKLTVLSCEDMFDMYVKQ